MASGSRRDGGRADHDPSDTLACPLKCGKCQASCRLAYVTVSVYAAPFRVLAWLWDTMAWVTASRSGLSARRSLVSSSGSDGSLEQAPDEGPSAMVRLVAQDIGVGVETAV